MKTDKLVVGILAHVDSGKTTLAESMLYISGNIRKFGRVDHKDAFLDTYELEKDRGITIFAKQAVMKYNDKEITLLDTPGHVDFSAEMERTLQVLDYAILVISAADGIQNHTRTLWSLLKQYEIPVFIFINKMDQPDTDANKMMEELSDRLSSECINFSFAAEEEIFEQIAMSDELLLNHYLEEGILSREEIQHAIRERKVYPCFFGSALKRTGIIEFLDGFLKYTERMEYKDSFSAKVYKITRDEQNNRLTHVKITGGKIRVKDQLSKIGKNDGWQEKIDQIRIYSGSQYTTEQEVEAGTVCAFSGLSQTQVGEWLGEEQETMRPILTPVLTYRVNTITQCNMQVLFSNIKQLEEEDPTLHVLWDQKLEEIYLQVMGSVQIEVLKKQIEERYHIEVEFDEGKIVYKETIWEKSIGIGHFEPLKHYAEVHLLLEPLERGSGLVFETRCSEDELSRNWQRLILTHLEEKRHIGILTGSEITDMKITLIDGKAHLKHTEGGDFRQATYRAVRQGLCGATNRLLEPVYSFQLEVPQENLGRAMADIQRMCGNFSSPDIVNSIGIINGSCPVATMRNYQKEVTSYTHGKGRLFFELKGYELCHNEEEVISNIGYDYLTDLDNTPDSVFCAHGAGFIVPWNEVSNYAHLSNEYKKEEEEEELAPIETRKHIQDGSIGQDEIDEIFERTFGSIKKKRVGWSKTVTAHREDINYKGQEPAYSSKSGEEYLLVDGYNIIFAWDELNELSKVNIDSARDKLMDIMCNYQGYTKCTLILVFDAYKVSGGKGSVFDYHNIHVVYTKEAETADQYIEKVAHKLSNKFQVTVATSDRLEQMIIWGAGARRISANGFYDEVMKATKEISTKLNEVQIEKNQKTYLLDQLSEEELKKIRGES